MKKVFVIGIIIFLLWIVTADAAEGPKNGKLKNAAKAPPNDEEMKEAFEQLIKAYGRPIAESVERIYRLETANFRSGQFRNTYGAGMEATKKSGNKFPYGWKSLTALWSDSDLKPVGTWSAVENSTTLAQSAGVKHYIKFPSLYAGLAAVAEIMKRRGNDPGKWFSLSGSADYKKLADSITPKIVNSI